MGQAVPLAISTKESLFIEKLHDPRLIWKSNTILINCIGASTVQRTCILMKSTGYGSIGVRGHSWPKGIPILGPVEL